MYLYDILTMKSITFRKNGEVLSGIKVGVIFLCVYFFSNRGGAIIGDRAIIRSFTVYIYEIIYEIIYMMTLFQVMNPQQKYRKVKIWNEPKMIVPKSQDLSRPLEIY